MEYCCKSMERSIRRKELYYDCTRGYIGFYIKSPHNEPGTYYGRPASYCPYCGERLHKDLLNELEEVLEKDYGIMLCNVDLEDPSTLPPEFQTDEWWKKRGL